MKKLLVFLFITALMVITPVSTSAQEITPDPSTYSYGSTSEFAQSELIGETAASDDDESLADTGQSQTAIVLVGTSVLAVGIVIAIRQKHLAKR